jgi:hypothetical protein
MTAAERTEVKRTLGPEVIRALDRVKEPGGWTRLAVATTFAAFDVMAVNQRAAVIVTDLWRKAGYWPPVHCDAFDADSGLSFAEAWTIAARHLVRTGRARQAEAVLRSGVAVRALLREWYGVKAGPEWDASAERRAFLGTLLRLRTKAVARN